MKKFLFRKVRSEDANEIRELTRKIVDEIATFDSGADRFPDAVSGAMVNRLKQNRWIGHVAIDPKTGKIVSYVGMNLRRRYNKPPRATGKPPFEPITHTNMLFRQLTQFPRRMYGWEDWLVTDPAYRNQGLATKLRNMNVSEFRKRFTIKGKAHEIFSRAAFPNKPRARVDEKTNFTTVVGVIGSPAEKYPSKKGIIARRTVHPRRKTRSIRK